ncbi:MAG: c-type cytochrome [Candidatus Polarisedimenticolaceae bacterium]|nr:c-type cytochrome [Candidatus Polarisedimenticolaceae bacterium]
MKKTIIALAAAGMVVFGMNAQARSGEEVYNAVCKNCHDAPMAAAVMSPEVGNKEQWAPRIAKGADALYDVAINGSKVNPAMTPRGTCPDCTDDELKAAVDYMIEKSQ